MVTPRGTRLSGHRLAADPFAGDPAEIVAEHDHPTSPLVAWLDAIHPPWHADAACIGTPLSWWFPSKGEPTAPAKRVCATCSVRAECLAEALSRPPGDDFGVWAGTSVKERKAIRRGVAS